MAGRVVFDTKFIVFNTEYIIFNTKFIIFNTKFIIFNTKFSQKSHLFGSIPQDGSPCAPLAISSWPKHVFAPFPPHVPT